jgi:predicted restriction endonuclease
MTFSVGQKIDLEKVAHDSGFEIITYPDASTAQLAGTDTTLQPRIGSDGTIYTIWLNDQAVATAIAAEGYFVEDGATLVEGLEELGGLLLRAWRLSRALPQGPLRQFEAIAGAPEDAAFRTEVERLVLQRRGQAVFRQALLDYWDGRCAVTGLNQTELLRASHIKPWTDCANDAERMDVFNGLLLTADWDAAFDAGLVTFDGDGATVFSPRLGEQALALLKQSGIRAGRSLTQSHHRFLEWHATHVFLT